MYQSTSESVNGKSRTRLVVISEILALASQDHNRGMDHVIPARQQFQHAPGVVWPLGFAKDLAPRHHHRIRGQDDGAGFPAVPGGDRRLVPGDPKCVGRRRFTGLNGFIDV